VSKRSFRRLAVVAGAALAVGSMAPAMAARIDAGAGAGAGASVDPSALITDITGTLPSTLPVAVPTYTQVNGTVFGLGGLGLAGVGLGGSILNTVLGHGDFLTDNILDHVTLLAGDDLGGDCGLVAVASCNGNTVVGVPVNASGTNVLGGGILNDTGDLGIGVVAPVIAHVAAPVSTDLSNVLHGGVLNHGLLGGGLLGGGLPGVNVLAAVVASL
jgi:hypothetical protein